MQNKQRMIDADMKDRFLKHLCEEFPVSSPFPLGLALQGIGELNLKVNECRAILQTFCDDNLIHAPNTVYADSSAIIIKEKAHDFLKKGGYALREEIFEASLKELLMKCEELERAASVPEKLKKTAKDVLDVLSKVLPTLGVM